MTDLPRSRLLEILETTNTIAVVGISGNPEKDANAVPRYLQEHGYRIVPVTPREGTILGESTRPSLADVAESVDVVQVFRPPEEAADIVRAAAAAGVPVVWFQPGTESEEAEEVAAQAGITAVNGMCMRATHRLLGLGGGAG